MSDDQDNQAKRRVVVWHFTDGKPGHFNQSLGLIDALADHVDIQKETIDITTSRRYFSQWLFRRFPLGNNLPAPDLMIGTGSRTHLPMLAARRVYRKPIVVMMKPQWPRNWFDHCIIPKHDGVSESKNTTLTDGAVNRIKPSNHASPNQGLFLIGGPSKHHQWDELAILRQIQAIVAADHSTAPDRRWILTTSRRTPASTTDALSQLREPALEVVPFEQTDIQWVDEHLANASIVWVSEDSVSMVYESLTAGAAVGLLEVPHADGQRSRVVEGLQDLVARQWVSTFERWQQEQTLSPCPVQLNEAKRCAAIIFDRFLATPRT